MLLIKCPYCGERDQSEFGYGGEAHRKRPEQPSELTDKEWADYLFMRKNIKGAHHEQWVHSAGCRKWFYVVRDTISYDILEVCKVGEASRYDRDGQLKTATSNQANSSDEKNISDENQGGAHA